MLRRIPRKSPLRLGSKYSPLRSMAGNALLRQGGGGWGVKPHSANFWQKVPLFDVGFNKTQKPGLGSRSRLEKKSRAGAAKKLAGSSALREDKKHKEIVLKLLFFK